MATGSATPTPGPPPGHQRVREVMKAFRPARKFKPSDSKTSVTSLDFDDTGELAIIARDDDTLQLYNCAEGKHAKELKSQKYGVHLARFSHHAQSVIYASTKIDDTIRFLSVHDNSFIRYFKGHTDKVTSICLSPADDTFISAARDDTVMLWDLRSPNYQGKLNVHAPYLTAIDPSASVIAIASPGTHTILLYDMRNYDNPPFATFDLQSIEARYLGQHGGEWTKMEFTNDGLSILISTTGCGHFVIDSFTGDIKIFAYRKAGHSGRLPPSRSPAGRPDGSSPTLGQGDVCLSPDGQFLLGGSAENGILVWDIGRGKPSSNFVLEPMVTLPCNSKAAIVGYNPRTNLLASADRDFFFWQPDSDLMM
ncbi:WD repeat-containing protein-like protein [Sporormia fimetaria CBS 119925]|uniref:WD repeat-containing protein-like protein n=1 Tax=Sporormia fimetaria CBS 119925 TaxID=1340428 RepID=A0A6A6V5L1_9PLEO|nr:WD repeat-containing protein-like protein [Sporormia fimetaria CBS 119925]